MKTHALEDQLSPSEQRPLQHHQLQAPINAASSVSQSPPAVLSEANDGISSAHVIPPPAPTNIPTGSSNGDDDDDSNNDSGEGSGSGDGRWNRRQRITSTE